MKKNLKHRQEFFMEDPALQNLQAPLHLPEGETLDGATTKQCCDHPKLSDNRNSPPSEGLGEAGNEDPALQNLQAPLHLPEGETLEFTATKRSNDHLKSVDNRNSPPSEGLGEAEKVTNESTFNALHKSETRIISVELKKIEAQEHPKYQTANSKTYRFIKEFKDELNRNPTEPERIMWKLLRNKNSGFKIRRQHIIDDFIVDFVCISKKLIIEIDGNIHLYQQEYDEERMFRLRNSGFEVIRFSNEEVLSNSTLVLLKIKEKLNQK
jgi:very-short-patch-repair endonuclease